MSSTTELARAQWRKSARSQNNSACVEFAFAGDLVGLRDSKHRRESLSAVEDQPIISLPISEWQPFLDAAVGGHSESGEIQICHHRDGGVTLRNREGVALTYTDAEWTAFLAAILDKNFVSVELV